MSKYLFYISIILSSNSAFAFLGQSDDYYKDKCLEKGIQKILDTAKANNCLNEAELFEAENYIFASSIDNRALNPNTYIWYSLEVECAGSPTITHIVQHFGNKCH